YILLFYANPDHPNIHSFPTRRSSDLRHPGQHQHLRGSRQHVTFTSKARIGASENGLSAASEGHYRFEISQRPRARCKSDMLSARSEEHTSELQSRGHLVCRLLLEKKK